MESQQRHGQRSLCHTCRRTESSRMKVKMSSSSPALLFALALTLHAVEMVSTETLCGGELVDALQFVCEDRGFYFRGGYCSSVCPASHTPLPTILERVSGRATANGWLIVIK